MANVANTDKNRNYTEAQEKIILEVIEANGGIANGDIAERLCALKELNDENGEPRSKRSMIAKLTRMDGVTYERKQPTTKDGKPVQKKLDIVTRIAELTSIQAKQLDGLEKAPKQALELLADYIAANAVIAEAA